MGKRWAEVPRTWSVALATVAAVAAASSRTVPGHAASHPSPRPAAFAPGAPGTAPFDVQAIVRRAHFAFREENGRFTGGHSTYEVESEAGRLSIRPVQRKQAQAKVGAALVLASSIRRGAAAVPIAESSVVDEEGRLVRGGPAVQEILENKDDGVELSWRLAEAPPGDGDLDVRLSASGLAYVDETEGGLHFRDGASSLGIRFGHATWIDADGRRTDVRSRWDGREIVMQVPRAVLDTASYPAVLDPLLGPEQAVDTPVFGPASGSQDLPSVAYEASSGTSLVAWVDHRGLFLSQVFCTRVNAGGTVLDANGILISGASDSPSDAFAVFDGTNFLVTYVSSSSLLARRVSSAGAVVDPGPIVVNDSPGQKLSPSAASDGTTTLVVWQDTRNSGTTGSDIYATRMQGASVLDGVSTGTPISTAADEQSDPKVAFGAGNWLVVWTDFRSGTNTDIYGARVGPAGTVIGAAGIPISTLVSNESSPWAASDGTGYLVVWGDERNPTTDIYGSRVTASGVVADPAGIPIGTAAGSYQTKPSAAFAGSFYQVVWEDTGFGLFGNRVVPSTGATLDATLGVPGAPIAGFPRQATQPRVFAAGSAFYLTWSGRLNNDSAGDLFGSRLSTAASMLDAPGVVLAKAGNGELYPAVAADGTNYLVAWVDDRGSSTGIYAARVNGSTGASLDPAGIFVSPGDLSADVPKVAFNGTQYLVVWRESGPPSGIYGTRVSTAGVVSGARTQLFVGPTNQAQSPSIASDGTGWLVVWLDSRNFGTTGFDVYGGRVSAAGASLDPSGIPISTAAQHQFGPRVAFGGGVYLVTWADFRSGVHYELYGARVTSLGVVQDPAGIAISTLAGNVDSTTHASAYAAPNFMVAYTRGLTLSRARVTAATGAVVDDVALAPCCVVAPSIAYDLDTFLILYNGFTPPSYPIRGTRVSTAGVDLDPTDWTVATGANGSGLSVAALGTSGKAIVAYSRYDSTDGVTSDRVRTRLLTRAQSDLGVTKTDGQTTAVPGATVTYTMTVSNGGGPDAAIGATVTDTVPGTLSDVAWTCEGSGDAKCPKNGKGNIAHTVDVPYKGSVTYTLTGTVSPSATGSLANTITVTAPAGWTEPNTADNSATDTDTLNPQADLAIAKTDGQATTTPGGVIVYTITASNAGPSAVTGATVADILPAGTTGASWTCSGAGGGTCAASGSGNISQPVNLPLNGSVTFTLTANVSPAASGTYSNTATVTVPGGVTETAPGNNSATDTDSVFPPNNTAASAKPVLIGSTSSDVIGAAPSDQNWFRFGVRAGRSYCVEVDNGKSDTSQRDTILDVYRGDGTTLFRTNDDIVSEPGAGLLSRVCYIALATENNLARVRGGANGEWGGIRVRVVETTLFCPWFGPLSPGSGFETFILIRNTTDTEHLAIVTLTGAGGAEMGSQQYGPVPANGSFNLQVSTDFGLNGASGGLWIAHEGPPGGMIANVTTLNFGSGVSYDTPATPRLDNRP